MLKMRLSQKDITTAQQEYAQAYPGDIYYNAAIAQIDHGINNNDPVAMAQGFAVLLLDWNLAFYKRVSPAYYPPIQDALLPHGAFAGQYFSANYLSLIEQLIRVDLLRDYPQVINDFRQRSIETFNAADEVVVMSVFERFQNVLGQVGTSDCLHLLAPNFFPPWNNSIAKSYGQGDSVRENNHMRYRNFMLKVSNLKRQLMAQEANVSLKAIDEYNKMRC